MYDKLVGYLLGALEADESARIERAVEANSDSRQKLDILRHALDPLEADREQVAAPDGLAAQTCERIRQMEQGRGPDGSS